MDCCWREVLHSLEAGEERAAPEWPLSSGSGVLTSICSQPEVGFNQRNVRRLDKSLIVMIVNGL